MIKWTHITVICVNISNSVGPPHFSIDGSGDYFCMFLVHSSSSLRPPPNMLTNFSGSSATIWLILALTVGIMFFSSFSSSTMKPTSWAKIEINQQSPLAGTETMTLPDGPRRSCETLPVLRRFDMLSSQLVKLTMLLRPRICRAFRYFSSVELPFLLKRVSKLVSVTRCIKGHPEASSLVRQSRERKNTSPEVHRERSYFDRSPP